MDLTPKQLHYFKRELIAIQLRRELNSFCRDADLSRLLSLAVMEDGNQLPFLHYVFRQMIVDFPLLKNSQQPTEFWSKCNEFLREFGKLRPNTYIPYRMDAAQRQIILQKVERMLLLALNKGIKTVQGQEETIKVTPEDLLEDTISRTLDSSSDNTKPDVQRIDVNVVSVLEKVCETRALRRTVARAEFVIRTCFHHEPSKNYYVTRRHGQFRQLYENLKAQCPNVRIPMVPCKDKSHNSSRSLYYYRERDRLALRSFLRRIASRPELAKSRAFLEFLTADSIDPSTELLEDASRRMELDELRKEQERDFRRQVDEQVMTLTDLLDMLKIQVIQPGGLVDLIASIKNCKKLQDLPQPLRKAFEWGRINFAFALHTHFVTDDAAEENVATLKRTHGLMPYRTIATLLRFSNPMAMVKGVLDLFLARPLGGKSLLQRVIHANMSDDINALQRKIEALEAKIGNDALCAKVANAVQTPVAKEEEEEFLSDHGHLGSRVEIMAMLRNKNIEPQLDPDLICALNENASSQSKLLIRRLYNLWVLRARKREHEILMALVFQGVTGELLRELFAIFYQPLAQVYKAASIDESILDVATFIQDLLELLDSLDVTDTRTNTIQPFVALVQRHEDKFYQFAHRVHANDASNLFDELVLYMDRVLSSFALGILPGHLLDLEQVTRDAGVSEDQYPLLRDEIDSLCRQRRLQKIRHLEKTRHKLLAHHKSSVHSGDETLAEGEQFSGPSSCCDKEKDDLASDIEDLGINDDLNDSEVNTESSEAESNDIISVDTVKDDKPSLTILPRIVPSFVCHVAKQMQEALFNKTRNGAYQD